MDNFITVSELLLLLAVFVGPFLVVGALLQFMLLKRSGIRNGVLVFVLAAGALSTVLLTWPLLYVFPSRLSAFNLLGPGGSFVGPAALATMLVSGLIASYAHVLRRRLPNEELKPTALPSSLVE